MRNKIVIMLLFMLANVNTTWAQQTSPRLVVWQKYGGKVYYELADMPETTFEGELLVIKTKNAKAEYYLYNILRYTYESITNAIDLMPNDRSININREGDAVIFENLREGSTVQVFAANGVLLETQTATGSQPLTVSIGQRPAGVYIVKSGSETIKLMRQ